jgi:hypothetical protein
LLIGLGFLSKYTNALELVSVILVLAVAPRLRQEFKKPGLYALLVAFIICTIPPIVWNKQHAWVTLTHLQARGSFDQGFGIHPLEPLKFVAAHFLFYSPLLFLGLAIGVAKSSPHQSAVEESPFLFGSVFRLSFICWFRLTKWPPPIGMRLPSSASGCWPLISGATASNPMPGCVAWPASLWSLACL